MSKRLIFIVAILALAVGLTAPTFAQDTPVDGLCQQYFDLKPLYGLCIATCMAQPSVDEINLHAYRKFKEKATYMGLPNAEPDCVGGGGTSGGGCPCWTQDLLTEQVNMSYPRWPTRVQIEPTHVVIADERTYNDNPDLDSIFSIWHEGGDPTSNKWPDDWSSSGCNRRIYTFDGTGWIASNLLALDISPEEFATCYDDMQAVIGIDVGTYTYCDITGLPAPDDPNPCP